MKSVKTLFSTVLLFACSTAIVYSQERPILDVTYVLTRENVVDAMF